MQHVWVTCRAVQLNTPRATLSLSHRRPCQPAVRCRGSALRRSSYPTSACFLLLPTLPPDTKGQVWPSGPPPNSPLIMLFSPHWHHEYCSDDWNNDQDSCVNYCLILFPLSRVYIRLCRPGLVRPTPSPPPPRPSHFVTTAFPKAMMNTRDRIWLQSSMVLNKMITVE